MIFLTKVKLNANLGALHTSAKYIITTEIFILIIRKKLNLLL